MSNSTAEELITLGDQHLASEEWAEANNSYKEALSLDPKIKRALLGRAVALRQGEFDYEQAQRFLNRCLFYYPGDVEALTEYGLLYAQQWDHKKAAMYFDQALSKDPTNRHALQGKVRALLAQGQTPQARALIESLTLNVSRPSWLKSELARVYLAEGAYDAAVEAFLDAGESSTLYEALTEQSDKKAKDLLANAIVSRLGDNAVALAAVGNAHKNWGDEDAAIGAYIRLIELAPKEESAYLQLIELFANRERFGDDEEAYQNAVRALGHASDSLLVARAKSLLESGQRDSAIEALSQVSDQDLLSSVVAEIPDKDVTDTLDALIERLPASAQLLRQAADRLAAVGNTARALELLDRVLQIAPDDIDAMAAKGEILLKQERWDGDEVTTLLKSGYSKLGPDTPQLIVLEANFLIARERYADGVRAAVKARKEADIQAHISRLLRQGDLEKAEKLVNAAVKECPQSTPFLEAQADLLMSQRSYRAAAKVWNALCEKNPDNVNPRLREATALRLAREFLQAAEVIGRGLRRASPESRVFLLAESGLLHYSQGQYSEAVQAFDSALAEKPDYAFAHLWKIRALRTSGSRDQAEAAVKQAKDAIPPWSRDRAEITSEMGQLLEARNEWKAAVDCYTEAVNASPDLAEPYFRKADALLKLNRTAEAESLLQEVLTERGAENDVRQNAGWFYLSKRDFRNAEVQFQEILGRSPNDYGGINGLGGLYFLQDKYDLAERYFRRALEIDQSDAALWNNLAWALVKQAGTRDASKEPLLADAERHCQKAIEISPKYASPHACLGIIAFKRGRLLECEEKLKYATELDPTQLNSAYLGALYAYLGRNEDAQKILEKGRELDRYDAAVRVELGNVYLQLGRTKDAITVLKEACAISPGAMEPVRALSVALAKAGDLIEAMRVLRSAIRTREGSSSPPLRIALCRILTELADKTEDPDLYVEALKEVRLAIAAQPKDPDAYFHAGVVCFKQKDYRTARKFFKQCYDLDNTNVEAEQNVRKSKALMLKELGRERIGVWVGSTVGITCLALLLVLWAIYLHQPLPTTKDAIRQIDSTMLLTLSPILLALVFVALLMPWLSKLKLPGGVEAEITQPKEQVSAGPTGPLTVGLGTTTISEGLK
jgi:tetratricopeptide (TPR) repeat protein